MRQIGGSVKVNSPACSENSGLEAILEAVASGDRAAFRTLYDKAGPVLFGVCVRLLRDRERAREAFQESLFRIWRKSHLFDRAKGDALTWMVAVTRNCVLSAASRPSVAAAPLDDETALAAPAPPDPAIAADLRRCLQGLNERYRECVVLAYHYGLTYDELARRMSAPVGTVKTWIHRAVGELEICLERR